MSAKQLEDFFAAFKSLDSSEMFDLYSTEASFSDEVFSLQRKEDISRMWRFLVSNIARSGRDSWSLSYNVESDTSASWEAKYLFCGTGRLVRNHVRSQFIFDSNGKVCQQIDTFDFWLWSRQALGLVGVLFGWTAFLKRKVRAKALDGLDRFSKMDS
jgi:hypothetical protein